MIIDNTKQEFSDIPNSLNGDVLLDRPPQGGFITCSQEVAYTYAVATTEQSIEAGHDRYDYSNLDLNVCTKPNIQNLANRAKEQAQKILDKNTRMPLPAKAILQSRINSILSDMEKTDIKSAIRLALQAQMDSK